MTKHNEEIIGRRVRDKITDFTGTAIGHCIYISGCSQTLVAAESKDRFSEGTSVWFDDQRLVIDESYERIVLDNGATPGFDKPAPIR